jgi:hypothetical protein
VQENGTGSFGFSLLALFDICGGLDAVVASLAQGLQIRLLMRATLG